MFFDAYGVSGVPAHKHRFFLGKYETEREARDRIKQAIASGFSYGYVKQGHEVIGYFTEESLTVRRIAEQCAALRTKEERGEWISRRSPLRIEPC